MLEKANKLPDSFYIIHEDFTQVRVLPVSLIAVTKANLLYAQDREYVFEICS